MDLLKRFIYYGSGLFIGIIFVFFIWDKKKIQFDYLPNARTLKKIRKDTRLFSAYANENMLKIGIDTADISTILIDGNVNFKKSDPRGEPCKTYFIEGNIEDKNIALVVKKCDTISTIDKVILN